MVTSSASAKTPTIDETLKELGVDPKAGLSASESQARLAKSGPNALQEKKKSGLTQFLNFFWGPIPWMIEAAAITALLVNDWGDFAIITSLLLFNAGLGFWEEHAASNALESLRNSLALKARVLREGLWNEIDASTLVPGDIVRLYLGDVVPADCKLISGDYLSVDQAALTGESLPVTKKVGDDAYSGSIVKQGEMIGVVTATGSNTFFGRTAKLVAGAGNASHFQQAVLKIGNFLIILAVVLAVVLVADQLYKLRGQYDRAALLRLYRIAMTIAIMGFVLLASMYYGFFPLTPIMIIALALLDDVPIMTIAFDNTPVDPKPVRWQFHQMLTVSSVLGLLAVIESFALLYIGDTVLGLDRPQLQTMMFLQLVAGGHLMLFVTRTRHAFWMPPYPNARLFSAIVATQIVAVLMCGYGWLVPQLPWRTIGIVWVYNLLWMVVLDVVKLVVYRIANGSIGGAAPFLGTLKRPLDSSGGLHHRSSAAPRSE